MTEGIAPSPEKQPSPLKRREIVDALRIGAVPRRGLELFAVGLERFEKAIDEELDAVAAGRGKFKAVRGEYGTGKTFFSRWLEHRALQRGFATTLVQISERDTPLYKMETVYRRAVEGLQTKEWSDGAFRSLIDRWFFNLEEEVLGSGRVDVTNPDAVAKSVGDLLEQRLNEVSKTQPQFAAALRACHTARVKEDHAISEGLVAWLMGQPNVGAGIKRTANLKGELDHDGAAGFLRGLLEVLKQTGRKGLVLVLDEVETIQRVRADSREKSLNALRQLIDDLVADRYPGLYVLITGTPGFFDGPQGVKRLTPLAQRLHTEFGDNPRFDSSRAPQIRLQPFDMEKMIVVGKQIRDLYPSEASDRIQAKVDDATLKGLAEGVSGQLGGKVGIAPRIFLKRVVDLIDRVDEFPDFEPAKDYKLVVQPGELTPEERAAAGASADLDDIELDLSQSDDPRGSRTWVETMAGGFDRLSGALQYQIVNTLGFSSLRPVQEQTIEAILEGDDCVVLAPTAGGKTEAAFFPLLSRMNDESWTPVSVLYLSPIRALLNNQEDRVQGYASLLGRRAFKWHGDVSDSARKAFLADPTDFLLTTPESLEAMMISPRVSARELFTGLRAVVIDEVHAFADDDRGAHLASVLERLSRFAGREVQRIGLSATVGNPGEILTWLRGGSERAGRVIDPGGAKAEPVVRLDYVATVDNAAQVIEAMHRGKKRLVFVDSRRGAEELGARLLELGVMTFVSHGSLSVTARRDAETAFAQGENCVIVATSALELGIDVGDLDHVLQIDAPPSVASYLQRMGRTGRRAEMGPPNCTFLTTKDQRLLQAAAIERLRARGFVEPVRPSRRASHILAHQIMSLAVQSGGVGREDWWGWLEGAAPYEDLSYEERQSLLDHMLHKDILTDHEGRLWLGEEGEKRYGRANFRALYAVFEAPRLIAVRHANQEIGTIDATFLASLEEDDEPSSFTLGGRNWQVLDIDWRRGRCVVKPAESGKAARWSGSPRHLSYALCQTMREILLEDEVDPAWSQRAEKVIAQLRAEFYFLRDGEEFINDNDEQITWHNFAGGAANLLLARLLEREVGGRVISRNTSLTFTKAGGKSVVAIKQAMEKLREAGSPTWSDALRFAPDATKSRVSKFQPCLPDHLARDLLVRKTVDLATARVVLGLDPHVDETPTKFEYAKPQNSIEWVRTPDELAAVADKLHAEPFIALDVETTLTDQTLCLAQVGTPDTNYLIDPFTVGDLAPLAAVLESDKVEKVIHNAQFEKTVLGKLGIGIENIYDTLTVSRRKYGPLAAGHSLLAVVRRELDLAIDKRCQTSDWWRRPLTEAQEAYAALGVEVLVTLASVFRPTA